jgi:Putative restriction endonuclease
MRHSNVDVAVHTAQWPADDTEESVMGSEYHQHVIDAVRDGLRMIAHMSNAPWHVLSQVPIAGFRRPNDTPYTMLPDVFVHAKPNPHPASGQTLTFAEVGVPLLALEVLSETTHRQDLDEQRGKAWSYADAGVGEYIVVDYARQYMDEPVRARRLERGLWAPWPLNSQARWESAVLDVSFAFDGLYLRVYDAAGVMMPLPHEGGELQRQRADQERQLARRDDLVERIRRLTADGDLAALRALLSEDGSA